MLALTQCLSVFVSVYVCVCVCLSSVYWRVLYWIDASVLHPLCSSCGDDGQPVVIVLTFISFLIVVALLLLSLQLLLLLLWLFFGDSLMFFGLGLSLSRRGLCAACQSSFHFTVTQIFISFSFSLIFLLGLRQRVLCSAYGCLHPPPPLPQPLFLSLSLHYALLLLSLSLCFSLCLSIVNIFPLFSISFHSFVTFPDCCFCCCLWYLVLAWSLHRLFCFFSSLSLLLLLLLLRLFGIYWLLSLKRIGFAAFADASILQPELLLLLSMLLLLLLLLFSSSLRLSPVRIWPVDWAREWRNDVTQNQFHWQLYTHTHTHSLRAWLQSRHSLCQCRARWSNFAATTTTTTAPLLLLLLSFGVSLWWMTDKGRAE